MMYFSIFKVYKQIVFFIFVFLNLTKELMYPMGFPERCDAVTECALHNTECHRVDGKPCCSCSEGFLGSGDYKCWSEGKYNYFILF